jgi:hypothetical protein
MNNEEKREKVASDFSIHPFISQEALGPCSGYRAE